jgi:hypothetical protein
MFLGFSDRNIFGRALFPTLPIGEVRVFNLLPFDEFGIPFSGWSIARRLGSNYTGNLIQVRRLADGALLDIGFDANNELDLATLTGFIGADSGFIRTIYDQTGLGNHFLQTTLANQPRIVNAGVLDTVNGKPAAYFDGVNDSMEVAASTATYKWLHDGPPDWAHFFNVFQFGISSNPNTIYTLFSTGGSTTAAVGYYSSYDDRASVSRNDALVLIIARNVGGTTNLNVVQNNVILPNQLNQLQTSTLSFIFDSSIERHFSRINQGGIIQGNTSLGAPSTANSTYNLQLGFSGRPSPNQFFLNGYFSEAILYKMSDTYPFNQELSKNQMNFYAIT